MGIWSKIKDLFGKKPKVDGESSNKNIACVNPIDALLPKYTDLSSDD